MTKVFILGGTGATGKLLAAHLLEFSDASLTLAGRRLERAEALAGDLNARFAGGRVTAIAVEAANGAALTAALAGHDVMAVTSPTTANAGTVIRAALDAGVDYLDVQIGAKKLALLRAHAGEIERKGRCFITEAGFHPGLPSALVRFAAAHFDRIDSAVTAGFLNMGRGLPYTEAFDELAEMLNAFSAEVYRDGAWTNPKKYVFRTIDFGSDIGARRCIPMFFEELRDIPAQFPTLKNTGFWMSESHWMVDWVIFPLVMVWLKFRPKSVRGCGKLLWWAMSRFHRPPYRVELQVQANGIHAGQNTAVTVTVSHADGYELTAIPVAAALLQYLDGSAKKPGLWMMGHFAEPRRLMIDMKRMGVRVTTLIN
jgi:saccharopine dehydrogenase (NAD+, L-lysine-forming)